MTVRIKKPSTWSVDATNLNASVMAGTKQSGSQVLPIGMVLGIKSYVDHNGQTQAGTTGNLADGTTWGTGASGAPFQKMTASGNPQAVNLGVSLFANRSTGLGAGFEGTYTYAFNVELEF